MLIHKVILLKICLWWISVNAAPKLQQQEQRKRESIHAKSWPPMKTYDIWASSDEFEISSKTNINQQKHNYNNNVENTENRAVDDKSGRQYRNSKVLNFFPVPMDEECLSSDGRRYGICFNVYECRQKGGTAKGECAMGFGVCCVFIASCDQEIQMNSTYIMSPNFPSAMPTNLTSCKLRIKMMSPDISQLRLDFHHFSLGQPNRKSGVCDGDIFQMTGGSGGPFILCGHNSGQHVYYDVGGRARQSTTNSVAFNVPASSVNTNNNSSSLDKNSSITSATISTTTATSAASDTSSHVMPDIEILMNFTNRIIPTRIWEIRILQIPFSQRAPAGCLQYFNGHEGIIQTFNFADNGRHLANQDYKACIRQERDMCSITYEPCDEQSFRIGPSNLANDEPIQIPFATESSTAGGSVLNDAVDSMESLTPASNMDLIPTEASNNSLSADSVPINTTSEQPLTSADLQTQSSVALNSTTPMTSTELVEETQTTPPTVEEDEEIEGSGGGDGNNVALSQITTSTRSPTGGGLDIFSFISNVFDLRRRRSSRQFFSTCTDRITMPCIVEDFISAGLGTLPGCEPVHCGDRFCSNGNNNCKIESTVTPFYLGVHFGDGVGKGSPEDNIGACIRYNQLPCL